MTTKEMIAVMQAYEAGYKIQFMDKDDSKWIIASTPSWNFEEYYYRVKPEPRVIYLNEYKRHDFNGSIAVDTPEKARKNAAPDAIRTAVRFVESPE